MKKCILYISISVALLYSCIEKDMFSKENIAEIEQTMKEYQKACMDKDSTKILNMLSPDIKMFQPSRTGKPIIGKKAVSEFLFPKTTISYPIIKYTISDQEIDGSSDFAFYQGTSKITWYKLENNIASDTTTSVTEFTTILKKEDNNWKIYRVMDNLKDKNYKQN